MFVLQTPKGELVKIKTADGEVEMEIRWNPGFGPDMTERIQGAQAYIDTQCLRLCEELIPFDTGILKQSGIMHTQIGSGEIKYRTPYARRWYYMPANFSEGSGSGMGTVGRGNYWFERMKQQHKEAILAGARKRAKAEGLQ
ncbi:MAG: hypothetical protein IJP31_04595 [Lachnospiraceae bacterium]|nr:hypothetical protein [Lachnospiraceae bacterium]